MTEELTLYKFLPGTVEEVAASMRRVREIGSEDQAGQIILSVNDVGICAAKHALDAFEYRAQMLSLNYTREAASTWVQSEASTRVKTLFYTMGIKGLNSLDAQKMAEDFAVSAIRASGAYH